LSGLVGGLLVLFLLGVVAVVAIYNRLVTLRNRYRNAYSQIDVQLKRRYDLIPNLVETSRAYLQHERETLEAVISARNQAAAANAKAAASPGDPSIMHALTGAESLLTGQLARFFVLAEAYPDLKANQTMSQLMEELTSAENRIAFARQAYNDAVMLHNTACEQFPQVLVARTCGFSPAELFMLESTQEAAVPGVSMTPATGATSGGATLST
jgi:LemA protein